jgi:Ulp1 family protease
VDTLYLPVHVNGNHWTLLRLDLVSCQYAYGDSLSASPCVPSEVLDILVWLLNSIRPGENKSVFTLSPQILEIPRQMDGFSCGIIVLSTIASILLDFLPWTHIGYAAKRMEWFIYLSETLRSYTVRFFILQ